MRKVLLNKWFILSALLTISLSAFSVVAYRKTTEICPSNSESCKKAVQKGGNAVLIWDNLTRQFSSILIH
jgi:hypothetical protein